MCGIAGIVGIESREAGTDIVQRMLAAMVHRGPDEAGLLCAPPVGAGMRRLSIQDLPGGSQPIWNETKTLAILFNGEIYNFHELRAQLEARGHTFRTRSDTEVIVHGYEEWGEQCVEHLSGMYAFVIVEMPAGPNGRPRNIFIARDPLGIKPLYYAHDDGNFLFASEVRSLLASGCVDGAISREALTGYLLFGSVCEPSTLISGIHSLPPGYFLKISADNLQASVEPKCYWLPATDRAPQPNAKSGVSPASHVRALLESSVEKHLIADVPVGVFLSSGLDSTALAALASKAQSGIHTFTVAFADAEFSEAAIARRTAEKLRTNHSELTLSDAEMVARLDEAIAAFDQPSMDGVNTYFVSWAARQAGLKVALSGLGSDEIFGGYDSYRKTAGIAKLMAGGRLMPQALRAIFSRAVTAAVPGTTPDAARKVRAAFTDGTALPHPYLFTRLLFTPETVASAIRIESSQWRTFDWQNWFLEATAQARAMDDFSAVSWMESRSYLANTLLRDTDSMSMRHSLEVRVPFLDRDLFESVLALPQSAKTSENHPKQLLIDALGDLLPAEIITQKKKTFTFPWENWLRAGLGERVAAGIADWSPMLQEHLPREFAQNVWNDFRAGECTWSRPWSLYVLNEWVKRNCTEVKHRLPSKNIAATTFV